MKKLISTFFAAALLVSLTGCNDGEISNSTNDSQIDMSSSDSVGDVDLDSTHNTNSSDNSVDSVPEIPQGEPTFLICPDGTPIYTSQISEIYTGSEEYGSKKNLTLEEAEQAARDNTDFNAKCDGFIWGYIPEPALNRVDNPEMFEGKDGDGSFDFLGETIDKDGIQGKHSLDFIKINVGDKFDSLAVKHAYTLFGTNSALKDGISDIPGAYIREQYIEFDGDIELEGYLSVTPMDTFYGMGGDMLFFPNGDSSTKIPSNSTVWDREKNELYHSAYAHAYGYFGDWIFNLGNMYKIDCDTSSLNPGDSFVKVRVVLSDIKYTAGTFGWNVKLKSIEKI